MGNLLLLVPHRLVAAVVLLALWLNSGQVRAQWVRQDSNLGAGVGVHALAVVDANVVWATSYNLAAPTSATATLTRTTNGGTTWATRTVNNSLATGLRFASISAVDANNAWVAMNQDNGSGGSTLGRIFRTTNGGTTWTHQNTAAFVTPNGYVNGVHMYSLTGGLAVGDPNGGYFELYTTADGGTTWSRVPSASIPAPLAQEAGVAGTLATVGPQLAWFGTSSGRVLYSANGGSTWQASITGLAEIDRIAFADANNGLALDQDATTKAVSFSRTTDGGRTWAVQAAPGGPCYGSALSAVPGTPGAYVSAGAGPTTSLTTGSSYSYDYGLTWSPLDARVSHAAVAFLDAQTGFAGGSSLPGFLTGSFFGGMYRGGLPARGALPLYCTTGLGGNACVLKEVYVQGTTLHTTQTNCINFQEPNQYALLPEETGSTANLTPGQSYPMQVRAAGNPGQIAAWLDSNRNNVFEASEYTLLVGTYVTSTLSSAVPLVVPAGAVPGPARLRVRLRQQGPLAAGDACSYFADGETRDFPVTIGPAVPLPTPPAWAWARTAGLPASSGAIATDPATGDTFVAGGFDLPISLGNGVLLLSNNFGQDAYVVKYNAQGVAQWARALGGMGTNTAVALAADGAGGVYVAGSYSGTGTFGPFSLTSAGGADIFVARLNASGTVTWARGGGGSGADNADMLAASAAGVVVSGRVIGNATFGSISLAGTAGQTQPLVLRYDAAGSAVWAQGLGSSISYVSGLALDAAGNSYAAAAASGIATNNVSSYNPAGTLRWTKAITFGTNGSGARGLALDNNGNLYTTGACESSVSYEGLTLRTRLSDFSAYLLKMNATTGTRGWLQLVPSQAGSSSGSAVAVATNGDVVMGGTFDGTLMFNTDVLADPFHSDGTGFQTFVARYDPTGRPLWGQQSITTTEMASGRSYPTGLSMDAAGNTYVRGAFRSNATFGAQVLTEPNTTFAFYLAKLGAGCSLPLANAGADRTTCPGGTAALGGAPAQAGLTYAWTVTPTVPGFASTSAQTTATLPTTPGDYTFVLTASNGAGCPASDRVVVHVEPLPEAPLGQPANRCGTGTVALAASGGAAGGTYQWYAQATGGPALASGTTGSFITPSLTATTTYYVSSLSAGGCEGPRTAVVATVDAAPVAALLAGGPTSFCPGGSVALTATGGTPGLSQYQFMLNGQPLGTASATATLTAVAAGSYSVIITNPGTACSGASAAVVVSLAPVPVAQAGATVLLCAGSSAQLGGAPTAGLTYQWSPALGLSSSTTSNPTVTLSAVGTTTYTLLVTNAQGCTATASVPVTVRPAAVANAGPNQTLCSGTSAAIGGAALTGYTYQWSPATGLSNAAASNPTVQLPNTGSQPLTQVYTLTATTSQGCFSTATVAVTVNPRPATPTVTNSGNVLTSSSANGNQWYLNGVLIVGATGATYAPAGAGTYTVVVTSAAGCSSANSSPLVITATRSSSNGVSLNVFPNPTGDGRLTVQLTGLSSSARLTVRNALGQVVLEQLLPAPSQPTAVNCTALAAGMYLLQVQTAGGVLLTRQFSRE